MEHLNRTTVWLVTLTAAGCAGVSTGPVAAPSASPGASPSTASATTQSPANASREAKFPLTFPDGASAILSYPADLDLARMEMQPDVDLTWEGRWVGAAVFSRGGPEGRLLEGTEPRAFHTRDGETIEEWKGRQLDGRHQETLGWLVYRLRSWTVHVPLDASSDAAEVVESVRPRETADGFVVLDVAEPAALAEGYGEAGGPQLAFGDHDPLPDYVRPGQDGLLIDLAPSECDNFDPSIQIRGSYGSACLRGALFVNGTSFSDTESSRRRLADIVRGLKLERLDAVR